MKTTDNSKNYLKAIDKLADYLSRRDHSVKELKEKMAQKKFSPKEVEQALDYAANNNWLPDPYELAARVTQQLHEKNKSHLYIKNYLHKKGLPEVEKDLKIESQKALAQLFKKYGKDQNFSYTESQKAYMFLKTKGFDPSVIHNCIKGISNEFE